MGNQTWNEANSLFWIKHYRDKVAAFESGEIYIRMQKEHREELAYQDRIIRRLKRDLAKAKAENSRIVRYWMQMAEDVRVECEKEKALMRKEIEKMRAEKEEAIHQRDEAKKIAQEKREEAYQAKTHSEEIQQKNDALTARIRKNFTNSSKPWIPIIKRSITVGNPAGKMLADSRDMRIIPGSSCLRMSHAKLRWRINTRIPSTTILPEESSGSRWFMCLCHPMWWNT